MSLSVFEVALYAMVLGGGADPVTCTRQDATEPVVICTNGTTARLESDGSIRFSTGIIADKAADGSPRFSNGITSHWGSAGWVQFTNKVAVRRNPDGSFKSNKGVVCRVLSDEKTACTKE